MDSTKQESTCIWSDSDDDGENTPAGKLKRFKVASEYSRVRVRVHVMWFVLGLSSRWLYRAQALQGG